MGKDPSLRLLISIGMLVLAPSVSKVLLGPEDPMIFFAASAVAALLGVVALTIPYKYIYSSGEPGDVLDFAKEAIAAWQFYVFVSSFTVFFAMDDPSTAPRLAFTFLAIFIYWVLYIYFWLVQIREEKLAQEVIERMSKKFEYLLNNHVQGS